MRTYLKRLSIAAIAVLALGTASITTSSPADARIGGFDGGFRGGHWGGHWRGPGFGFAPAFAGALAFGALAAPYYYGGIPVGYYGDCYPRRRIVGHTAWGQPIVRVVRSCYY